MKFFANQKHTQKIIIALILVILINFSIPMHSYADAFDDVGGKLLKEIVQFVVGIGDVVVGALNNFMLGTSGFASATLGIDELRYNLGDSKSALYAGDAEPDVVIQDEEISDQSLFKMGKNYEYPNMLYSPENIFGNKIAMLDVNFLQPNKYSSVVTGETVEYDEEESLSKQDKQVSAAAFLSSTIATWYRAFRNIAIVGLLTVLVYIGIKILLSSTAADKAKYKERLQDWFVALCLVFVIHMIMSGILMLVDQVNNLFDGATGNIIVEDAGAGVKFKTNLMGLVRFRAQAESWQQTVAYSLIYLVLIIYTIIFTFQYLKRFLYMAFFTMIAPLVALTYPIDRAGDGKSQAFNLWFKEYTMNAIIQPIHLLLYAALVSTSIALTVRNPIYALVAIAFMIPAEKFIKKMFGLEADTTSNMGSFAGGALAMTGLQKLASLNKKGLGGGKSSSGEGGAGQESPSNAFVRNTREDFSHFGNEALPEGKQDIAKNSQENQGLEAPDTNISNNQNANGIENQNEDNVQQIDNINQRQLEQPNQEDTNQAEEITKSWKDKAKDKWEHAKDKVKNDKRVKYTVARAKDMAPTAFKAAKGTAKAAARIAGTTAGATIGLAAGLATGDASKAFTYATAGGVAGNTITKNATNLAGATASGVMSIPGKFENRQGKIQYMKDEAEYGAEIARQRKIERENQKAETAFLADKKEQEKWENVRGKLGYEGSNKELMQVVADYKKAGVNDDKIIENALKMEKRYGDKKIGGSAHKQVLDVASFTAKNNYGREYVEDKEKRVSLDKHIDSKVSDAKVRKQIKQMHADLYDAGHLRK